MTIGFEAPNAMTSFLAARRRGLLALGPLAAMWLIDLRLGLAAIAGVVAGLALERSAGTASPADGATTDDEVAAHLRHARVRDQMHEIEVERLEGRLAELERRLEDEQAQQAELLTLFDDDPGNSPDACLQRIRSHLQIRNRMSAPFEAVALGDLIVECIEDAEWPAGEVTVTDALPSVLAPLDLVRWTLRRLLSTWAPIPPITIGGRIDGGMALVHFDGLGIHVDESDPSTSDISYAVERLAGRLLPRPTGVTLALPVVPPTR